MFILFNHKLSQIYYHFKLKCDDNMSCDNLKMQLCLGNAKQSFAKLGPIPTVS